MKFNMTIRPTVYTGQGTYRNAIDKFYSVTPPSVCLTFSKYGNYYGSIKRRSGDSSPDYAYCYNMDVFKRGKHKNNKHYTLYVYKIDLRLLDILGAQINQHQKHFRIVQKNK